MFRFERRWLLRIFDAIYPGGTAEGLRLGAADVPIEGLLEDIAKRAPFDFVLGLRAGAWVVTLFGPLLTGRFRRFAGLSVPERGEVLEALAHSRLYLLREIPMLLKMVASLGYLGVPQVQRELGVPSVDREPPEWARSKS
ncbi:MAG: hypothetical protein IPI43_00230 [Sandaracinaceae bacterium]|jgi:hypothetical protein|nr:hypothetical protein [Sandaracinaceae bacterium]MBK7153534.1 hypothetical protein [Sandaracinaceae bacterium]MBK7772556.1 hypothetical protein [Sandaracinaceae bacterium]MBK8587627.1 hypothetical protein [Sandaracinaceae bacterium]